MRIRQPRIPPVVARMRTKGNPLVGGAFLDIELTCILARGRNQVEDLLLASKVLACNGHYIYCVGFSHARRNGHIEDIFIVALVLQAIALSGRSLHDEVLEQFGI